MKKPMSLLFILPVCIGLVSFAVDVEPESKKPTTQEIEQVQDYLADCLEQARNGNFNFSSRNGVKLGRILGSLEEGNRVDLYINDLSIAFITYKIEKSGEGYIRALSVKKDWRNQGIAVYLLWIAGFDLLQKGVKKIEGYSGMLAEPIYRRLGAKESGDRLLINLADIMPETLSEQELEKQRRLQEAEQELQKMKAKI